MIDRAHIAEALEAAALAVALHGPAYAPIFARLERAEAEARAAEESAEALQARARAIAAQSAIALTRTKGARHVRARL